MPSQKPQKKHKQSQRQATNASFTLDSCLVCLKTRDKLVHLLGHLKGEKASAGSGENTLEQIIEGLDAFIEDLLSKDREVEMARAKVNTDVEKLIQNQESFERRVSEMDQVYAMLINEQKRLKQRKASLDGLQNALPQLSRELTEIRRENDRLRYEVSIAVEEEVRKVLEGNRLLDTNLRSAPQRQNDIHNRSYDLPRQMDQTDEKMALKRKELVEWENNLLDKSRQMEEAVHQFNAKMQKMSSQKAEIQQNVKRLQELTNNYQQMLQTEQRLDKKMITHKAEIFRLQQLENTVGMEYERTLMQREDQDTQLQRERGKLNEERDLVHQLRSDTLRQKQAWAASVTNKEAQLKTLAAEKKEELSIMEVAIRRQITDAKQKEHQLYEKEDEMRRVQLEQLTELDEQKKSIVEERNWLESVRDEVDQKMHKNSARAAARSSAHSSGAQRNIAVNRGESSDMPRQMPSEIDRQLRESTHQHSRWPSQGSFMHHTRTASQPLSTTTPATDLSIDQASKLDNLLVPAQFGGNRGSIKSPSGPRDRSLIEEDSCDQALRKGNMGMLFNGLATGEETGGVGLSLLMHSHQSSLNGDNAKEMVGGGYGGDADILSSIQGNAAEHELVLRRESSEDFDNVPPTFRGQPDRPNQYFSLTEDPQHDRRQDHPVPDYQDDKLALLRQSDANIFSKPMNPYTVLEAKLDEMKEEEDILFQFKTTGDDMLLDY